MGYRWLEHTSELALRIDAPTETGVFELASEALGAVERAVERVVAVVERAGLAARVAQREPLGVVKG